MHKRSRQLLVLAALLMGLSYIYPLWSISMQAPQYPEGLGIYIWGSRITGLSPYDLQNLNLVNHYIGMQAITPESIPELKIIPIVMAVLIFLTLLTAWKGKSIHLAIWVVAMAVIALIGLTDFYLWNYDFGHNLDLEHAAIKIPGMTYQPPIFGTKQLLNFVTTSLPATGGVAIMVAILVGVTALVFDRRSV